MMLTGLLACLLCLPAAVPLSDPPAAQQSTVPQAASSAATQASSPQDQRPALNPNDLPVSVDRIQRALERPPAISLKVNRPVFRVEVFGRKPTLEDVLGEKFWIGATPYGGMTHQEFLEMVTPKLAQPYAGFTPGKALTVAATTIAFEWALRSAIHKYQSAQEARAREAARKEVLDALAALEKARRAAGLPDK